MTRVNCIPPDELTRQHLLAEYREIPRVVTGALRAHQRGATASEFLERYPSYRLGRGHVSFFCPRLGFIARRFDALKLEMTRRRYVNLIPRLWGADLPSEWWNHWVPTPEAEELCRQRIEERLGEHR